MKNINKLHDHIIDVSNNHTQLFFIRPWSYDFFSILDISFLSIWSILFHMPIAKVFAHRTGSTFYSFFFIFQSVSVFHIHHYRTHCRMSHILTGIS